MKGKTHNAKRQRNLGTNECLGIGLEVQSRRVNMDKRDGEKIKSPQVG